MAAPSRKLAPDVEESLVTLLKQGPFKVKFFQAVRLLRRLLPHRKPVGYFVPSTDELVRFTANPSLDFPASEIQSTEWPQTSDEPVKMAVNFMGLCAPNGVLPTPYTELIIERSHKDVTVKGRRQKDNGFRDFLDIFNHRLISLFYRAWEKHRFFVNYECREPDQLSHMLLSLIGLGTKGLSSRETVPDHALAFYGGLLGQHPRSAQGLRQVLEDYFQVPVEVQQFVGKWVKLPASNQICFDGTESPSVQLGVGAVVGDEIWDQQSTIRIKLGPLSRKQYLNFLPTPHAQEHHELKSLLKFYSNDEIDFEVQLLLKQEETPRCHLSGDEGEGLLLGWLTWINNAPLGRDPGETILQM